MRWLRYIFPMLVVISASAVLMQSPASACTFTGADCPVPDVGASGIGYHYDSTSEVLHPKEVESTGTETGEQGSTWQTKHVRSCEALDSDAPADISGCANVGCEVDGERAYMTTVMRRESGSDDWAVWPGRTNECWLGDEDERPVPIREVEIEISRIVEDHYERIARPEITVEPKANALVNLPVIASTADQGTVSFDITYPVPGRIEASPTYEWKWSDGSTSNGPGRPYDGVNPADEPGHYPVQATFGQSGTGSVTLTATWSIALTLDGGPPITDIEPLVYEATEDFRVRSAKSLLVD